jgi:hypothetical protein
MAPLASLRGGGKGEERGGEVGGRVSKGLLNVVGGRDVGSTLLWVGRAWDGVS